MHLNLDFNKIKMIISDFDGIFTDGTGMVDFDGRVSKRINFHDVLGIAAAFEVGLKVVIITGEEAGAIKYLCRKFEKLQAFQGIKNKLPLVKQIVEDSKLTPSQIVYIGDDINDMPSLQYAGFKVTVPNANYVIKEIKEIQITEKKGGEGVFREVVDAVIYNKFDTSLFAGEK